MRFPEVARRLLAQPRAVLPVFVLVQWGAVAALAASVEHNGWLFFQGGDQTWYYTTSWALSDWSIPPSIVGYGWAYLIAPFASLAGPNFLVALPGIVLLQVLVLLPVALLCVYGIAAGIGGRRLGYAAAAIWVAAPFVAIPLFDQRYHERYVEQFLPQALGLTGMADFPSMVFALVAAFFVARCIDTWDWRDAALAGLATGFAIGVKPSNFVFLAAPVLALLVARRLTQLVVYGLALAPCLYTLSLWKERGLGYVPSFTYSGARLASALDSLPIGLSSPLEKALDKYNRVNWGNLEANLAQIREYFWSVRLLEWLVLAGVVAVARRSPAKAVLLAVWFGTYLVFKGSSIDASVESGSFFRFIMPGFPPVLLFAAALPLLLPHGVWQRVVGRTTVESRRPPRSAIAAVAGLLVAGPLLVVGLAPPLQKPVTLRHFTEGVYLPVDESFVPVLTRTSTGHRLTWTAPAEGGARLYFNIYRVLRANDVRCQLQQNAAAVCIFDTDQVGFTTGTTWEDSMLGGPYTYRVGLSANWRNRPVYGDVLMLSAPVVERSLPNGR